MAQAGQVERAQAADKSRQARRAQVLSKDVAARDDELEHQVESTDRIHETSDEGGGNAGREQPGEKKKDEADDEPPHIDVVG